MEPFRARIKKGLRKNVWYRGYGGRIILLEIGLNYNSDVFALAEDFTVNGTTYRKDSYAVWRKDVDVIVPKKMFVKIIENNVEITLK